MGQYMTQPIRVKIALRKLGPINWEWRLLDFFYNEIERGSGCRTKDEARGAGYQAKRRYLDNLKTMLKN